MSYEKQKVLRIYFTVIIRENTNDKILCKDANIASRHH